MSKLFRKEAQDHKRNRLEGSISLVQPPIFFHLMLLILIIVLVTLTFLSLGDYTRKERVSGVITPDEGLIRIKALQTGIISEILVSESQHIEAGMPLLRIASTKHSKHSVELNQALFNQYSFQQRTLEQQLVQQQQEDKLELDKLRLQKVAIERKLTELKVQSDIFQQRLLLNKNIVKQVGTLKGSGYISDLELQRQRDILLSLEQQQSSINTDKLSYESELQQLGKRLAQLPLQQQSRVAQLLSQKADLQIQISSIEQQRLGEIRAPKSGVISGLTVKAGSTVSLNQSLLSLLPQDSEMQAVVYIPTSAFGFIDKGQQVTLRYHAFPYEKFGVFKGMIEELSQSVILPAETDNPELVREPAYRAIIRLDGQSIQAYGKSIPLRAGMLLDADIIIEERSLLGWLFDPIFSIKGRL